MSVLHKHVKGNKIFMRDVFIDTFVLLFVGTLILILFCIGTTIKEPQPILFWIVPGLFYMGAVLRFMFRGFFSEREPGFIMEEDDK